MIDLMAAGLDLDQAGLTRLQNMKTGCLIAGSLLNYPMVSGSFKKWGASGAGKYVTLYANAGHIYMEVAGLRLDTSPIGDYTGAKGPRWRPVIGKRSGFKVRLPVGL